MRIILGMTTALSVLATAHAQTATGQDQPVDAGSVSASGSQGSTAPSATGSLKQAEKLQKFAPNVINVQPQSQIRKLPDVNIAEALQRVPGISMESDTGEGRFINIRGLDADLNGGTFDKVNLPVSNQSSPTGGARAIAYDSFPSGVIGGVEVVKSLTPDMDAQGLGGSVNLLPISLPNDDSSLFNASLGTGFETLRNTGIFQGSVTFGTRFGIPGIGGFADPKPFGVIGNYTYDQDRRGIDDVEEDYNSPTAGNQPASLQDLQFRHYSGSRVRKGAYVELDFNPNPEDSFFIRVLQAGYDENLDKNRLQIVGLDGSGVDAQGNPGTLTNNGAGNFTATGANALKNYTNSNEYVTSNIFELGGHTLIDELVRADVRAAFTQGSSIFTRNYSTTFNDATPLTVNYGTGNASYRTYNVVGGTDLSNPNLYTLSSIQNSPSRAFDQEYSLATDFSAPTDIFGYEGQAKIGGQIRFREQSSTQSEFDGTPIDPNITLAQLQNGDGNVVYYKSHYAIGPDVNYQNLFSVPTTYTQNIATSLGAYQHNAENVYAGYIEQTMTIGKLGLLGGVRVEATDGSYGANIQTTDSNGNTVFTPNVNHQNYVNLFPSFQAKYEFTPQFQVRAAFSTGIARPGFQQISAAKTVDFSQFPIAVTQGNPSLQPTTGNSFDLTAEFYTAHEGLLTAGVFYKQFSNYIVQTIANGTFQGQQAQITSYSNIGGAYAEGIELDANQRFYFLPHPLDGLGIDANLTLVDSAGHIRTGERAYQLPSTSPTNYNLALTYEKGPFQTRLAASYVSRNLFAVGSNRSTDQFSQARFRLDFGATLQISKQLQLYVDAKNLTNTKLEFTQSSSLNYPIQREFYQQDFLIGLRYKM